eukprot:3604468-Rhodomonas_salina.7
MSMMEGTKRGQSPLSNSLLYSSSISPHIRNPACQPQQRERKRDNQRQLAASHCGCSSLSAALAHVSPSSFLHSVKLEPVCGALPIPLRTNPHNSAVANSYLSMHCYCTINMEPLSSCNRQPEMLFLT